MSNTNDTTVLPTRIEIIRGFHFGGTTTTSGAADRWELAREQLQQAHLSLEATLAAVLESCPDAIDNEITHRLASTVLKARRIALERRGAE